MGCVGQKGLLSREASFKLRSIAPTPPEMDASDAVDLVRVATCSRVLHDLFSDGVVKASMEHCREASERADIEAAHFNLVGDALHDAIQERGEVAQQRDAALDGLRESNYISPEDLGPNFLENDANPDGTNQRSQVIFSFDRPETDPLDNQT